MPLRCSTSVVLPAPLGPSSATRSPAVDVQVDAEERLVAVGVGVGEPADVEDGGAHRVARLGQAAGVAARQHREVDPLAALVGADEQRAERPGQHRPVPRGARVEAARAQRGRIRPGRR